MWARGPDSLAQDRFSDEKQRSPKSHSHKGRVDTLSAEKREPSGESARQRGSRGTAADQGHACPVSSPSGFPQSVLEGRALRWTLDWLTSISPKHRRHRSHKNPGQQTHSSGKTEGFRGPLGAISRGEAQRPGLWATPRRHSLDEGEAMLMQKAPPEGSWIVRGVEDKASAPRPRDRRTGGQIRPSVDGRRRRHSFCLFRALRWAWGAEGPGWRTSPAGWIVSLSELWTLLNLEMHAEPQATAQRRDHKAEP